jgi:phosphoribosylanthranilate isomerase
VTPTAVKICGITTVEDGCQAAVLGAAAIGFVFWPESPRCISVDRARAITRELPPFVATVGVFVNHPPREVLEVAASVPLTAVQFHGDEDDESLSVLPVRVIRALSLEAPGAQERLARLPHTITVLLDAHDPHIRGGTGRTTEWEQAAPVAASRRILLAGGLRAENVGEAIRVVRPWGIDVSSGVESTPGRKDLARLRALFAAVHAADIDDCSPRRTTRQVRDEG